MIFKKLLKERKYLQQQLTMQLYSRNCLFWTLIILANIYMFKVNTKNTNNRNTIINKRNTRKKCEMCSKLTIKTPERYH